MILNGILLSTVTICHRGYGNISLLSQAEWLGYANFSMFSTLLCSQVMHALVQVVTVSLGNHLFSLVILRKKSA